MLPYFIEQIKHLGQDEGLTDKEIADVFGCSRATVNRARIKFGIPTAKLENRRDKEYTCTFCHKVVKIRRKERKKRYCDDCRESLGIKKT